MQTANLEWALKYARMGWYVLPVHSIKDGKCTCSKSDDPAKPCPERNWGKHPRTEHGLSDASNDEKQITEWFTKWPDSNIGIHCEKSDIDVLDIDPRNGGDETLRQLLSVYGDLPTTVKANTGGGGTHDIYSFHKNFHLPKGFSGHGLDIRKNAYIVVPPSLHKSGKRYEWVTDQGPGEISIAPVPSFLIVPQIKDENIAQEGTAKQDLEKLSGTQEVRGEKFSFKPNSNGTLQIVVNGESTGAWIDLNGYIGSHSRGGPTIIQWIEWYNHTRDEALKIAEKYSLPYTLKNSSHGLNNSHISLNSHLPEWVNPIKEDAYYGLAGDFIRKIEPHTESDSVAILVQFLTYFGNVVGNKPHFKVEATDHHLKINSVLAGPTSKGRKGTAFNIVNSIYRSVDSVWADKNIVSGLSSGEGVISTLSDDDDSIKDKRLLIVEQEFSSTLKVMARDGNILSGIIRQSWDGKDLRNMTKNNPLRATDTHISIIAHITMTELKKYLNETERANGFGNRFLFLLVKRSKSLPEGGKISSQDFSHLVNKLREAVEIAKTKGEIKRDEEAKELWKNIYEKLSDGKAGVVGDLTARAEAYVMRMACIYALLDSSTFIRLPHLKAALAVWEYAESSVEYIFGDMSGNLIADKILIALKAKNDGLSKTEINNLFSRHCSANEINVALEVLLKSGKVNCQNISTEGRDKEVWGVAK